MNRKNELEKQIKHNKKELKALTKESDAVVKKLSGQGNLDPDEKIKQSIIILEEKRQKVLSDTVELMKELNTMIDGP